MSVTVTETDANTTVCVAAGGTLTVTLHGAPGQVWRPVVARGDSLTATGGSPSSSEVTSATFVAARAGTTDVTSSRSACPPPSPGSVSCKALQAFTVTVEVR